MARGTPAACPDGGQFDWMLNDWQQDPCKVATALIGPCLTDPSTAFVPKLRAYQHYTNPGNSVCDCNTEQYTLISACAFCQGAQPTTWSFWSNNCTNTSASYPLDKMPWSMTTIPEWATQDVLQSNHANLTNPNMTDVPSSPIVFFPPESSQLASSEPGNSATSTPALTSIATPAPTATVFVTSSASNKTSVIAGVVGGVGGLAVLVVSIFMVFWLIRKARGNNARGLSEPSVLPPHDARNSHARIRSTELVPNQALSQKQYNANGYASHFGGQSPKTPTPIKTESFADAQGNYKNPAVKDRSGFYFGGLPEV